MNYSQRFAELNAIFRPGIDTHLPESDVNIRFFSFQSSFPDRNNANESVKPDDIGIQENLSFVYPVFMPAKIQKAESAILLLHGLNERIWNKYLTWAEYLCVKTGKPVILFPIAFHLNRSPDSWFNPRMLQDTIDSRRRQNRDDRFITFANVALSMRISETPSLFYTSGRQTLFDLETLFEEIKLGKHSLFKENTQIDIFAYSIGAFLAQITLMTNPKELFSDSKLFMFCGGSIFSKMYGVSRSIMDKAAYEELYHYYVHVFGSEKDTAAFTRDKVFDSFFKMTLPERNTDERLSFFRNLGNKMTGILLEKDRVVPYSGVMDALGFDCTIAHTKLCDFPFSYSHENPFPVGGNIDSNEVNNAFINIFSQAARFLE